jgi:LysR family carnitine catabolism transcriptional activator
MITISALRNFVTVAETREIRAAGERLRRTPSAVSMSLKQLEDELGARLFVGDRKNKLTAVGGFVANHAREILRHHDRATASIKAFALNGEGRVDVACVPSFAISILPLVIADFRKSSPGVEISVRDADSAAVIAAVEAGEVGIGIASAPQGRGNISYSPLFSEKLGVVCRADSPLAAMPAPLKWSAIRGEQLLSNRFSAEISRADAKRSQAPIATFTINSALGLVRAGLGIAILSQLTIPPKDEELVFLPLDHRRSIRHVGIVMRSEEFISPAEARFAKTLKAVVKSERARLNLI